MCDIILASPTAKFGQPEINLGVIPGGGGSQRLTRIIGKSRAMEMVLTGRTITAEEADKWGMISRVVGQGEGQVVKDAVAMAKEIADKSQIAVHAGKEVVNEGVSRTSCGSLWRTNHCFSIRNDYGRRSEVREEDIPRLVCHQ